MHRSILAEHSHDCRRVPARISPVVREEDVLQAMKAVHMNQSASIAGHAGHNRLLSALPALEQARLLPLLEPVVLVPGTPVYEAGRMQAHVYFPTTAIVSMLNVTADGTADEIAIVGNDGVVGIALFMGGETMPSRAVVHEPGGALRWKAALLKREFDTGGAMQQVLLRYTQALMTQMSQTSVCIRRHSLDQQLCRLLLQRLDRHALMELALTQELIAGLLGVRRESVTEAAGNLQRDGLIRYGRGRIVVQDRAGLEQRVCECYALVCEEYRRLMSISPG